MSDIKSAVSRVHTGRTVPAGAAPGGHGLKRLDIDLPPRAPREVGVRPDRSTSEPTLLSDFIAPPSETADWLGNPVMGAALSAVSGELAPGGVASSKRDQYVASVVETHLAARKQLAKHLNSLLRA